MHLSVAILNNNDLAKKLGKKSSENDIAYYSRIYGEHVFTLVTPMTYIQKMQNMVVSLNFCDAVVLYVDQINKMLGEEIILLDYLGIKQGIIVLSENVVIEQLEPLMKDNVIGGYKIVEDDQQQILDALSEFKNLEIGVEGNNVLIDQFFQVKSVGTVLLGKVISGSIKPYDKLQVMPAEKEILVKSIQVQDKSVPESGIGTRVGLAIKGIDVADVKRGMIATSKKESMIKDKEIKFDFEKNKFYKKDVNDKQAYLVIGMQSYSGITKMNNENNGLFEAEHEFIYQVGDTGILVDPNTKEDELRIIGKITIK